MEREREMRVSARMLQFRGARALMGGSERRVRRRYRSRRAAETAFGGLIDAKSRDLFDENVVPKTTTNLVWLNFEPAYARRQL